MYTVFDTLIENGDCKKLSRLTDCDSPRLKKHTLKQTSTNVPYHSVYGA